MDKASASAKSIGTADTHGSPFGLHRDVEWRLEDGFLHLKMPNWMSAALADQMAARIRQLSHGDPLTHDRFAFIHRLARMGHEVLKDNCLTHLDLTDVHLLYGLKLDTPTDCLLAIFNTTRNDVRKTDGSIIAADHFAKRMYCILDG